MVAFSFFIKLLPFLFATTVLFFGIKRRIKPKIFVQIASYRDPECQYTVEDIFEKAKYHKRINVGICWQFDKNVDSECFKIPYQFPKQVRVIEVDAKDGKGVCWARNLTQSLYRGEKYTLVIDSHMRFVEGWDEKMIEELNKCGSKKAILTCYPAGYKPPNNLENNPKLTVQIPTPFNEMGDIRFKGEVIDIAPEKPINGKFLAAGFMFSNAKVIKEVPYDPYMYFNQEEISYAVRLFTHDWDIYHPTKTLLYHYYKSPNDSSSVTPLHWEDNKDWGAMQRLGRQRLHYIMGHKENAPQEALKELEKYGLGKKRSLKEFEEITGVNFKDLTVSEYGLKAGFIENLGKYKSPAAKPPGYNKLTQAESPIDLTTSITENFSINLPVELTNERVDNTLIMVLPIGFKQYIKEFLEVLKDKKDLLKKNSLQKICITSGDFSKIENFFIENDIPAIFFNDSEFKFLEKIKWKDKSNLYPISIMIDSSGKIIGHTTQRNAFNHVIDIKNLIANN